jgi:serine/threonine protein kinase
VYRDAAAAVHAHIAIIPTFEEDSDIPVVVKDLVLKLLEKDPKKRYSSTANLLADLDQIIALERAGFDDTKSFIFDESPCYAVLREPERLVGREKELKELRQLLQDNVFYNDHATFVLIKGASGYGKSSLVKSFAKNSQAIVCEGKFLQFDESPYGAISGALDSMVSHLISLDKARLDEVSSFFVSFWWRSNSILDLGAKCHARAVFGIYQNRGSNRSFPLGVFWGFM